MSKLINSILAKCPPEVPDYICIKTMDIYFPYAEMGIDCLVRDISELSLVFEVVLSLTEINITDINEICEILGLSFDIVKEIVVDLVAIDYVTASEGKIRITPKGIQALKNKKSIQIKKYNLNCVAVDLITGRVFDSDSANSNFVSKQSVCLEGDIVVNLRYLERNNSDIQRLFEEQQKSINDQYRKSSKELYRMVSIHHQNLRYLKKKLYIYKSINSAELQFHLDGETDGPYLDALYDQLKSQSVPGLEQFFERDRRFVQNATEFSLNQEYLNRTIQLRRSLINSTLKTDSDFFIGKRYSFFDKEYMYYFEHDNEIQYNHLIIYSNRIKSICNRAVYEEIKRISETKTVIIIYDKSECGAKSDIDFFIPNDQRRNIHIIESSDINQSIICFDNSLLIDVNEYVLSTLDGIISYKIPVISDSAKDISNLLLELSEIIDIKSLLAKGREHVEVTVTRKINTYKTNNQKRKK